MLKKNLYNKKSLYPLLILMTLTLNSAANAQNKQYGPITITNGYTKGYNGQNGYGDLVENNGNIVQQNQQENEFVNVSPEEMIAQSLANKEQQEQQEKQLNDGFDEQANILSQRAAMLGAGNNTVANTIHSKPEITDDLPVSYVNKQSGPTITSASISDVNNYSINEARKIGEQRLQEEYASFLKRANSMKRPVLIIEP